MLLCVLGVHIMIRIKQLRLEQNLSLRILASELHIAYSSLGKYERGEQQPSFETLIKIANYFNVSTDYLLGISNTKSTNLEISYISNYLGLNEDSIKCLNFYSTHIRSKQKVQFLNTLLSQSCDLLEKICDYLYFSATHFKNFYDDNNKTLSPISDLELWDDIEKISYSDDWDLWSRALLLIVEDELTHLRTQIQNEKMENFYNA